MIQMTCGYGQKCYYQVMSSPSMRRVEVSIPRETLNLLRQAAEKEHLSVEEFACMMLTKKALQDLGIAEDAVSNQEETTQNP